MQKMSTSSNTNVHSHKLNGNLMILSNKNQTIPKQHHPQQHLKHQEQKQQSQQQQKHQQSQHTQHRKSASPLQQNQTSTIATVHHQISTGHHHSNGCGSSSNSSNSSQQQQQQHQHQHQHHHQLISNSTLSSGNSNTGATNQNIVIPPRYQPPPQPHPGGILKHIPIISKASNFHSSELTSTTTNLQQIKGTNIPIGLGSVTTATTVTPSGGGSKVTTSNTATTTSSSSIPQLNIKYPPEVPKLSSLYIPDTVKGSGNSSRFLAATQRPPPLPHQRIPVQHLSVQHQNPSHHYPGEDTHFARQQHQHQHQHQQQQSHQHNQQQEMLKFVRKSDADSSSTTPVTNSSPQGPSPQIPSAGRLTIEQSRQLQQLLADLRALKEANQRLSDDNQELRDLCCFLDDDRQKGRKLAREWQRFGRYTASVMRQEVSAYQNKLRQLDDKQQELIRDNLELKELCLYLDEERAHVAANALCANCGAPARPPLRDDGDGSSSSTNNDETITALRQYDRQIPELNLRATLSDQTLQYVRSLERRIRQLEGERLLSGAGVGAGGTAPTGVAVTASTTQSTQNMMSVQSVPDPISGRPEAVVRALQVLEVREQLERDRINNNSQIGAQEEMDDGEKALVREMCNVVWRKLEENPNGPNIDPL